ncbi:MAG: VCBS repeat-containing protein [Candidatus Brocadiae bacterium]|nr:VCBS repeat-containing protein [Candidatus Brocadiia bacterium]
MSPRPVIVAGAALLVIGFGLVLALRDRSRPAPLPPADAPETTQSFIRRPATWVTDIGQSEAASDRVGGAVKSAFIRALREQDRDKVRASVTSDFLARFPGADDGREVPDATMLIRDYPPGPYPDMQVDAFFAAVESHLQGVSFVERTTWRTYEFLVEPDGSRAVAKVHFQLAGPMPDGTRRDLVASVGIEAVATGDTWKLRRLEWLEGTRIQGRFRPWRDITQATGFHVPESRESARVTQALIDNRNNTMFGGIAVVDVNRDGFWDLLATRVSGWSRLFVNDGHGGFIPEEGPPVQNEGSPASWLCVDLDNDGQEEIVGAVVLEYTDTGGYLPLYRKVDGRWVLEPRALFFSNPRGMRQIGIQGIVPEDIDGNGYLDLFYCVYSNGRSLQEEFNTLASFDGNDNWLFMNHGGLKFTEESDARGITGTQYTFCAKIWDLDFDGDLDIYECNDYGPNAVWVNDGNGRFSRTGGLGLEDGSNYTMGVTIADFDNTGQWWIYISNMYSHAGNRIVPLAAGVTPELRQVAKVLAQGNQLYRWNASSRRWDECGVPWQVNQADWAWGCLFADFDNDTDKDIFVANGFTSNADASAPDY